MSEIAHKLIMLKPMQTGVSGYARLQTERGRALVQLNVRGMECRAVRAFWYAGGGLVRELGSAPVNPKREAALQAELPWDRYAPDRLQALLLVEDGPAPRPLMIGLCAAQSAGSLLDAKNASLSLCERIKRENQRSTEQRAVAPPAEPPVETSPKEAQPAAIASADMPSRPATPPPPGTFSQAQQKKASPDALAADKVEAQEALPSAGAWGGAPKPYVAASAPGMTANQGLSTVRASPHAAPDPLCAVPAFSPSREIFLPAIDPSPYIPAAEDGPAMKRRPEDRSAPGSVPPEPSAQLPAEPQASQPSRQGVPVGRLESLRWPKAFAGLSAYFDRLPPCRILDLPGWRFVCASRQEGGLWLGYWQLDGLVRKVAYVMGGEPRTEDGRPYQRMLGVDGRPYRVLVQRTDLTSPEQSPASTRPGL